MEKNKKKIRALGLCSGGLDSILSALVLREQGIETTWVTFETPFFSKDDARRASEITGVPLIVKDISDRYLVMLKNPPAGYGKNMNPCMDCHALMFKIAGEMMSEEGFDFLFSGEVAGQRPMSQTKQALRYVEKNSKYDGYIVRPLSAKILPVTIPEEKGQINRDLLMDFSGRSRKPQIELAKKYNITEYPAPAGGCALTEKEYSIRLKDIFDNHENYSKKDFYLLRHGRHFRLDKDCKIVVGRSEKDNDNLTKYFDKNSDAHLQFEDYPGPSVLITGKITPDIINLSAQICASYTKLSETKKERIVVSDCNGERIIEVSGGLKEKYKELMI